MSAETMQQSLFEEANRLELAKIQERERKAAFRVAFDFLEKHYPPGSTVEYWVKTCSDLGAVAAENIENVLCQELLIAVMNFLDKITSERGGNGE